MANAVLSPQRDEASAILASQINSLVLPVSITGITASNVTQTTATITVSRSNPAAGTLYLVIVPQGVTPTWSRANIATNSGWTATTVAYHDADTDPGSGATYQFVPDASGLTAGTPYDLWAVWDDGATTVGPVQGTGFSTASAGTTYNDTLSESATLADSTAAANLLTALLAETVALADGVTAGATFAQTLIESVTTAESASALMAFSGVISETVSLLDQLNTGNVFNETHAAAVTPADSLASPATFTALSFAARVQATSLSARLQ